MAANSELTQFALFIDVVPSETALTVRQLAA